MAKQGAGSRYERLAVYPLDEVLPYVSGARNGKPGSERLYDGHPVWMNSLRYQVFTRGTRCVACGLEGSYFALERAAKQPTHRYHFNLYGRDEAGEEVMLTKDHILPKSKGGKDSLNNLQTMCKRCNEAKGNGDIVP
jgi:hypothetical protein